MSDQSAMGDRATAEERQYAVLSDRVNSANATHLKEQTHLNALNTEMAQLQQRIQAAKDKVKESKEVTIAAIGDQSKYVSRLFADAIYEKLPRELRDMIYDLLWIEDLEKYDHLTNERPWRATEVLDEDVESNPPGWCTEYGFPVNQREGALGIYPQLYFVDPEFMGDEMARESAEAFYRLAGAYIETLDEDYLKHYFQCDQFFVGVKPRPFITSVTFFLDMCDRQDKRPDPWRNEFSRVDELRLSPAGIKAIFVSKPTRIPKVTLLLYDPSIDTTVGTLERTLPLYSQLKDHGATITIEVLFPWWYEHHRMMPIDLSAIMELPRNEWQTYVTRECKRQRPDAYNSIEPFITHLFIPRGY